MFKADYFRPTTLVHYKESNAFKKFECLVDEHHNGIVPSKLKLEQLIDHCKNLYDPGLDMLEDFQREEVFDYFYIERLGFTVVTKEFVAKMSELLSDRKVLEVGAGRGTFAHAMRQHAQSYRAIEDRSLTYGFFDWWKDASPVFGNVEHVSFNANMLRDVDDIVICWPDGDVGYEIVRAMEPGQRLIVLGDSARSGDFTGTELFWDAVIGYRFTEDEKLGRELNESYTHLPERSNCVEWSVFVRK